MAIGIPPNPITVLASSGKEAGKEKKEDEKREIPKTKNAIPTTVCSSFNQITFFKLLSDFQRFARLVLDFWRLARCDSTPESDFSSAKSWT